MKVDNTIRFIVLIIINCCLLTFFYLARAIFLNNYTIVELVCILFHYLWSSKNVDITS